MTDQEILILRNEALCDLRRNRDIIGERISGKMKKRKKKPDVLEVLSVLASLEETR
jgi:hypothetical protein